MDDDQKKQSEFLLSLIRADGGTDIFKGMEKGWSTMEHRTNALKNTCSCVFLLTDGQDTSHMSEKMELATKMKASGACFFYLGLEMIMILHT